MHIICFQAGFRLFDTATIYGTEEGLGNSWYDMMKMPKSPTKGYIYYTKYELR